jgi:hypothetical protein
MKKTQVYESHKRFRFVRDDEHSQMTKASKVRAMLQELIDGSVFTRYLQK